MTRARWQWGILGLAWIGLMSAPASAAPLIESVASAEADEPSGEDPGLDTDTDTSTQAGISAIATAFRCPGDAICDFQPGDLHGARGIANTSYGSNRASAFAESGYDFNSENDVIDAAQASSTWADDWTFLVAPSALGQPVSLEFRIDGSWANGAFAEFQAGVFDPSVVPPPPGSEDPEPFLPQLGSGLAGLTFQNDQLVALVFPGFTTIPIEDGGQENGSVDITVVIQFVPSSLHTYAIAARLFVSAAGDADSSNVSASFDSTAALTRVIVPEGVSFTSGAGASYDVVVPEPGLTHLFGFGAAGLALSRRREAA